VSSFEPGVPIQGVPKFSAHFRGIDYLFASAEHPDAFQANPEHFAPQ
jgi:YHS domain-containing protein